MLAGELLQASAPLLPAATANVTPAAIALLTASLSDALKPPPRLMLAAIGTDWLAVF